MWTEHLQEHLAQKKNPPPRSLQNACALGPTLTAVLGEVQGYLAHKKQLPPWTLQYDYAEGSTEALGGGAVSYD